MINLVKHESFGQDDGQILCKYLKMNCLQSKQLAGQSNRIKVNQTDLVSLKRMANPAFLLVRKNLGVGGFVFTSLRLCVASDGGGRRQKPMLASPAGL
jgi:hypothetical protein